MCRQKMFLRYGNLPNTVMTVANVEAKIKGHSGCRGKGGRFKKKKSARFPLHIFLRSLAAVMRGPLVLMQRIKTNVY